MSQRTFVTFAAVLTLTLAGCGSDPRLAPYGNPFDQGGPSFGWVAFSVIAALVVAVGAALGPILISFPFAWGADKVVRTLIPGEGPTEDKIAKILSGGILIGFGLVMGAFATVLFMGLLAIHWLAGLAVFLAIPSSALVAFWPIIRWMIGWLRARNAEGDHSSDD